MLLVTERQTVMGTIDDDLPVPQHLSALVGSRGQRRPTQGTAPVLVPRIGLLGNLPMSETAQKTG